MGKTSFKSRLLACYGISMGDEGKGRVICELAQELHSLNANVNTVLKVNGGANSGHTAAGLKLNLLPSGITEGKILNLALGSGVVADPRKILWEALPLEAIGCDVLSRLAIDECTQVSDVTHRLLDLACEYYREKVLSESPRGSTGRGITPAFVDEVGQWQIRFLAFKGSKGEFARSVKHRIARAMEMIEHVFKVPEDIWHSFFEKLTHAELIANKEAVQQGIFEPSVFDFRKFKGEKPFSLEEEYFIDTYWEAGSQLRGNIKDVREVILSSEQNGDYTIGEFGQSFWLDKRHGFTPNVTASHAYPPEFFLSAGIPVQPIHSIGCCKAYDTKVGTHLFLTQMPEVHPLAQKLSSIEYGTTTGRHRMVGWFDAVEKGNALRYGGFDDLVINKLDVLSYSGSWQGGELLICTSYRDSSGAIHLKIPRDESLRKTLVPVYKQLPGWTESITDIRSFDDLPINAKRYISEMVRSIVDVAYLGVHSDEIFNLRYVGVGPEPGQIINDIPDSKQLIKMAQKLNGN